MGDIFAVNQGKLMLGTWQGIYLCEHRDGSHNRKLVATLQGKKKSTTNLV